jgi:hypothetical protein
MNSILKIVGIASATVIVMMLGSSLRLVAANAPPDQNSARIESQSGWQSFVPETTEPPPLTQGSGSR